VIEPEPAILRLIDLLLSDEGFQVVEAPADHSPESMDPGLVLIDIPPPEEAHLDVLRDMRARTGAPIIAMTTSDNKEVRCSIVDLGADDFVVMPFDPDELVSRVRFLTEPRVEGRVGEGVKQVGSICLDLTLRRVLLNGTPVRLSLSEWRLLEELAREPGDPRTMAELLSAVWGPSMRHDQEFLTRWIARLQAKLGCDPRNPVLIKTYHNIGYVLSS
jgi:two-component system KDP operon response regulator KdpE